MAAKTVKKSPAIPFQQFQLKCKRGSFCTRLHYQLHEANAQRAGLSAFISSRVEDGSMWLYGVVFRQTARDKGRFLNWCPFCGKRILWDKSPVLVLTPTHLRMSNRGSLDPAD